jgi:hypothetical protein
MENGCGGKYLDIKLFLADNVPKKGSGRLFGEYTILIAIN